MRSYFARDSKSMLITRIPTGDAFITILVMILLKQKNNFDIHLISCKNLKPYGLYGHEIETQYYTTSTCVSKVMYGEEPQNDEPDCNIYHEFLVNFV